MGLSSVVSGRSAWVLSAALLGPLLSLTEARGETTPLEPDSAELHSAPENQVLQACPELGGEAWAELQARVLSSYLARNVQGVTATFHCSPTDLSVRLEKAGALPQEVSRERGSAPLMEQLLELNETALQARAVDDAGLPITLATGSSASGPEASPSAALASGADAPLDRAIPSEKPQGEPQTAYSEARQTPGPQAEVATAFADPKETSKSSAANGRPKFGLPIGPLLEIWGSAAPIALGLSVGPRLVWPERWGVAVQGDLTVGLEGPGGVRALDFGLRTGGIFAPIPWLSAEAGVCLSTLFAISSLPAASSTTSSLRPGAFVALQLHQDLTVGRPYFRVGLDWLSAERQIVVSGVVVQTIPQLQAVLSAGWEFR